MAYNKLTGQQVVVETTTVSGSKGRYELRIVRNEQVEGEPHYIETYLNGQRRGVSQNYPTLEAAQADVAKGAEMIKARG